MKQVTDSDTSGLLNSSDVCNLLEILKPYPRNLAVLIAIHVFYSQQIISKKLVTFRDIEELQQNNQKLLNVIRDLSDEFERAEAKLQDCNKEELEVVLFFLLGCGLCRWLNSLYTENPG